MAEPKEKCPTCGRDIPNKVLYRCYRCHTEYCSECEDSLKGVHCPKCGMNLRLIMDQN